MISNYAELQQSIANYTHRADLVGVIPDFIRNAEARLNRTLRCMEMERRVKATIASEYQALPNDYLAMRNIQVNSADGPRFIEFVSPQQIDQVTSKLSSDGAPCFFTIVGGAQMQFSPVPTSAVEIEVAYYQRIPVLGSTIKGEYINTNWVLDKHPDAYLYGALLQSEAYGYKDSRLAMWKQVYDETIEEINRLDRAARWGGGALRIRRVS